MRKLRTANKRLKVQERISPETEAAREMARIFDEVAEEFAQNLEDRVRKIVIAVMHEREADQEIDLKSPTVVGLSRRN